MITYRPLPPTEIGLYRDHLLRLSSADRRARFMGAVADDGIHQHIDRLSRAPTRVLAAQAGGEVRAAVELCLTEEKTEDGTGTVAELAVSVEPGWQDRGLGSALVRRALTLARQRGVGRVYLICLPENRRMQRIATRLGARLDWVEGEVTATIDLATLAQGSTMPTILRDALDRAGSAAAALADRWTGGRKAA
ncbi:MAG: hypothetical protein RLY86_541 [Pseudomonadota bacterium]|jgi:RimJ/RimL family protein N-acetyltransferase